MEEDLFQEISFKGMSKTQQGDGSERAFHECSIRSGIGSEKKVRLKS